MPIEILMPALSPTMTEGNLARWLKKEGDEVRSGDVVAEIETDKATMEVEAVEDGRIGRLLVPEGARASRSTSRSRCFLPRTRTPPTCPRRRPLRPGSRPLRPNPRRRRGR